MLKYFLLTLIFCIASNAHAGLRQLEIIGIVPDVSTPDQVEKARSESGYIIGGYNLQCSPSYINNVLSNFLCLTGEKYYSGDMTDDSYRIASNIEIHKVLVEGFTQKFGPPTAVDNSTITNRLGTEFNKNITVWIDEKGNKLSLLSIATELNEGAIIFESAQQIKTDEEENRKKNQQRKF